MKKRVLVVDDDASTRAQVRAVLERVGFEVTTSLDGREAIALVSQSDFDVVLVGVRDVLASMADAVEH